MDLATLGFGVDTSRLVQGEQALDRLAQRAGSTATAAGSTTREVNKLAAQVDRIVAPLQAMARQLEAMARTQATAAAASQGLQQDLGRVTQELERTAEASREGTQVDAALGDEKDRLAARLKALEAAADPLVATFQQVQAAEQLFAEASAASVPVTDSQVAALERLRRAHDELVAAAARGPAQPSTMPLPSPASLPMPVPSPAPSGGGAGGGGAGEAERLAAALRAVEASMDPVVASAQRLAEVEDLYARAAANGTQATAGQTLALEKMRAAHQGLADGTLKAEAEQRRIAASLAAVEAAVDPVAASFQRLQAVEKEYAAAAANSIQATPGQIAALDQMRKAHKKLEDDTRAGGRAMARDMREVNNLGIQVFDVVQSLGSGMNPLTILLQQGPEIHRQWSSIPLLFKLLGEAITPVRAAIGLLGAAFLAGAVLAESADRALAQLSQRLRATRDDYADMARAATDAVRNLAGTTSLSGEDAGTLTSAVAGSRNFRGTQADMERLAKLGQDVATVLGIKIPEAATLMATALNKPTDAAKRLMAEGFRGMNADTLQTVANLEALGRRAEATQLVLDTMNRTASGATRDAMTPFQRALDDAAQAATRLWQMLRPGLEVLGRPLLDTFSKVVDMLGRLSQAFTDLGAKLGEVWAKLPEPPAWLKGFLERFHEIMSASPSDLADKIAGRLNIAMGRPSEQQSGVAPGSIPRTAEASRIQDSIRATATALGEDPAFALRLAQQESGFRQYDPQHPSGLVTSRTGNQGVFQLGAAAASDMGVDRTDTAGNIVGGIKYIQWLRTFLNKLGEETGQGRLGEDNSLVAVGFNAGPRVAKEYVTGQRTTLPAETLDYIAKTGATGRLQTQASTLSTSMDRTNEILGVGTGAYGGGTDAEKQAQALKLLEQAYADLNKVREAGQVGTLAEERALEVVRQARVAVEALKVPEQQRAEQHRDMIAVLQAEAGAARVLAQAEMSARQQADKEGGDADAAAAVARARAQQELNLKLRDTVEAMRMATQGDRDLSAAFMQGATSAGAAEIAIRAKREALQTGARGSVEAVAAEQTLTKAYQEGAAALADRQTAANLPEQARQLEMLQLEISLVGQSTEAREREVATLRARQDIQRRNGDADSDVSRAYIAGVQRAVAASETLRRTRAVWDELSGFAERAFDRIGAALTEGLVQGKLDFKDLGNVAKGVLSEIIQEFTKLALLRPLMNSLFNKSDPTLWDLGGSAAGTATAAAGAGGGGAGGSGAGGFVTQAGGIIDRAGNMFTSPSTTYANLSASASRTWASMFGPSTSTAASTAAGTAGSVGTVTTEALPAIAGSTVAEGGIGATTAATVGAGETAAATVGGVGATSGAASTAASGTSGAAAAGASGGIGAAVGGIGAGFAGGSMVGGMIAGENKARQQNAMIGAGVGAVAGAFFGPVGSIVGGMIGGAIGGMIGPKNTNAAAGGSMDLASGTLATNDSGKSTEGTRAARDQIGQGIKAILDTVSNAIGGGAKASGTVTYQTGARDPTRVTINGAEYAAGVNDPAGAIKIFMQHVGEVFTGPLPENVALALRNSRAETVEQLVADVQFGKDFERTLNSLRGDFGLVDKATDEARQAVRTMSDELHAFQDRVAALGLDTARSTAAVQDYLRAQIGIRASDAQAQSVVAQNLAAVRARFEELGPMLAEFGISAQEAAQGLQNALDAVKTEFWKQVATALGEFTQDPLPAFNTMRETQTTRLADANLLNSSQTQISSLFRLASLELTKFFAGLTQAQRDALRAALPDDPLVANAAQMGQAVADLGASFSSLTQLVADAAQEAQSSANSFRNLAGQLRSTMRDLRGGDLSVLDPGGKLAAERARFNDTVTKARGGDQAAIAELPGRATSLLQLSRAYNASGEGYTADFTNVETILGEIAGTSETQAKRADYNVALLQAEGRILGRIQAELGKADPNTALLGELNLAQGAVQKLLGDANAYQTTGNAAQDIIKNLQNQGVTLQSDVLGAIQGGDGQQVNLLTSVRDGIAAVRDGVTRNADLLSIYLGLQADNIRIQQEQEAQRIRDKAEADRIAAAALAAQEAANNRFNQIAVPLQNALNMANTGRGNNGQGRDWAHQSFGVNASTNRLDASAENGAQQAVGTAGNMPMVSNISTQAAVSVNQIADAFGLALNPGSFINLGYDNTGIHNADLSRRYTNWGDAVKDEILRILRESSGGSADFRAVLNASASYDDLMAHLNWRKANSISAFAEGGVMTQAGPAELRGHSAGGIATSPQVALWGEASKPEAFIPLDDGRSVPVTVRQSDAGTLEAFVPLSGGRTIPVTLDAPEVEHIVGPAREARRAVAAFAEGGVMTSAGPRVVDLQVERERRVERVAAASLVLPRALAAFADGGVMTGAGPLPLRQYEAGGIANSPQVAMWGEGSTPEAFVPLRDGRTIPVTIAGGAPKPADNREVVHELRATVRVLQAGFQQMAADNAGLRGEVAELRRKTDPDRAKVGRR